ncbi:MAG: DNA repair and recombination protein RadB [Methanothermobacter sp.]|nr:DNA repair and recombination protein RadB [Methanothermobacter sp.]
MKLLSNFKKPAKIPTGCSLDKILGGGVEKRNLTQFYGPPGSGKTNIAIKLAVETAKNHGKVIFIDTEGGISIERIKQVAGKDFDKIAKKIILFEPGTFHEQGETIRKIWSLLQRHPKEFDLIILDSAVALYRLKDGSSPRIHSELGNQMALLLRMAKKYDLAVVITNQIYSLFDAEGRNAIEPVGGTILKYWSKIIIELQKGDVIGERRAILKRHKNKQEGLETTFRIVENGLEG